MYLVFDVGGTFVKYAWMTVDGDIVKKDKIPTRCNEGDTLDDFVDSLVEVYASCKTAMEKNGDSVEGIAVSLPGVVDVKKGIVYGGGSLRYMDKVPFADILSVFCDGVKVVLENDGKCAALAELWKGNAQGLDNVVACIFGSGIGGGIIIDGKIHRGNHLLAGEISNCYTNITRADLPKVRPVSQLLLNEEFEQVPFLWSSTTSTRALCYQVSVAKHMKPEDVSGELIYQWAEEGDEMILDMLEDFYFRIARQLFSFFVTVDPDVILLGGGISAQPAFIEGVRRYVDKMKICYNILDSIKLDTCKFLSDSNLYGALYNFLHP